MSNYTPLTAPMNLKTKLQKEIGIQPIDPKFYQSLVGALLHATISRWDIQYPINCISRYLTKPQMDYMIIAKNILRYLKGSLNHGIFYPLNNPGNLLIFSDVDWAGDLDSQRSTSGILYKLRNAPIAWSSKLQQFVSLSSTEVKYRILSEATRNITYLRRLFHELNIRQDKPTTIYCDNICSIRLVKNPVMHAQTKHFNLHHYHIREKSDDRTIQDDFIPSKKQQADLLTKPLVPQKFIENRNFIGLTQIPSFPNPNLLKC
jgi:hypothetical protein